MRIHALTEEGKTASKAKLEALRAADDTRRKTSQAKNDLESYILKVKLTDFFLSVFVCCMCVLAPVHLRCAAVCIVGVLASLSVSAASVRGLAPDMVLLLYLVHAFKLFVTLRCSVQFRVLGGNMFNKKPSNILANQSQSTRDSKYGNS